jgi:hypothetical protein
MCNTNWLHPCATKVIYSQPTKSCKGVAPIQHRGTGLLCIYSCLWSLCHLAEFLLFSQELIMSKPYTADAGSNLPEVNHQEESYAYALPVQSPAYVVPSQKNYYPPSSGESSPVPATTRKTWMRWWVLALIGLFVAVIAGLVGGFIGQAIQKGREPSEVSQAQAAAPAPSSCSNSTSAAPTPSPGAPANAVGTIVIPDTGCDFPASKERRRIDRQTTFTKVNYTIICNSGWPGSDAIIGLFTLSPSDCMEACAKYNEFVTSPTGKRCVGGGFIPDWTNQTLSAKAQGGSSFNCYLKDTNKNIVTNDRAGEGLEVVALCLEGLCNGIGGS